MLLTLTTQAPSPSLPDSRDIGFLLEVDPTLTLSASLAALSL
ncbi:MAG: hypothetical protein NTX57_03140 [Armatimonadetes bacterium]|nr:hypothetical protein [Armatimonadota bacterium]